MKGSTAETARKRPERPWTAARTMEVLRRCPLAIAQRLVHCAIAVSTAVLDRVTKTRCQCTSPQLCTVCVVTCGEPSLSPKLCLYGQMVSPYHAIFKCPALAGRFKSIADKLRLPPDLSCLCRFRDDTGWGLAVDTAKLIFTSGVAAHI